jgi:hypothetical protein
MILGDLFVICLIHMSLGDLFVICLSSNDSRWCLYHLSNPQINIGDLFDIYLSTNE